MADPGECSKCLRQYRKIPIACACGSTDIRKATRASDFVSCPNPNCGGKSPWKSTTCDYCGGPV